ncbi:MAG: twin-arginine translocase TatA/TatE family subunit [Rubripirellula sp.]|nr:twin-arginine translocase TatA/TatE family subunit [Rubripirellula sp.]
MIMNTIILGFGMPGLPEMMIVGLIVLLLFGSTKLPLLMRNLGRSTNEFKQGMKDTTDDEDSSPKSDESN